MSTIDPTRLQNIGLVPKEDAMPEDDAVPTWSIRTWVELGGAAVTFAAFFGSFGLAQYQIGELQKSYAVLEESRRSDHDTLVRMENDVRWIRQTLERGSK